MKIAVAKETRDGESRVAMVPELVGKLTELGWTVAVEPGAGNHALIADEEYAEAGATVDEDALAGADLIVSVQPLHQPGRPPAAARDLDDLVPADQPGAGARRRPARLRGHLVGDGAGAADLPRAVDGRALVAGPGRRLPLRDRRGRHAAPVLPAEHDRRRHRPAGHHRGARRRRRRASRRSRPPSGSAPSSRRTTSARPPPRRSRPWVPSRSSSSWRRSRVPAATPAR